MCFACTLQFEPFNYFQNNKAYSYGYSHSLRIFDFDDPLFPLVLGDVYHFPDNFYDFYYNGDTSYSISGHQGYEETKLEVLDFTELTQPRITTVYKSLDMIQDVELCGDYAYVAGGYSGLYILNVSNPENPVVENTVDTASIANEIFISGNYAYVVAYSGFKIFDISNPIEPILISYFHDYDKTYKIIVVDSLAYVIRQYGHPTHDYYVAIFNIQDPAIPTLVNTIEHPNWVSDIKVVNNIAYVSYYRNGIGIYDVSNADSINLLGYYFRRHNGRSIDVRFPYIYKASTYVGIEIIDVSDPANPFSAHKIDIIN